jgi:translocation and assembly module TamB
MHLDGTTDRPELGGTLTVNRGDFWLSDATSSDIFEPITLSDADLATLQQRFGLRVAATDTVSFDAYETLTIKDLTVQMRRDTWVRSKSNPRLDIQLTGDLDVSKAPFEDALVFGSVSVLPERSRIVQFGQRFDLERGELTFNGAAETPDMSLEASYLLFRSAITKGTPTSNRQPV